MDNLIKKHVYYTIYNIDSSGTTNMILSNIPAHMKAKEKNLIAMAREVEVLRAEILNAEKRVNGSFLASVCHSLFM